jgi:chromate transport protein ChrA
MDSTQLGQVLLWITGVGAPAIIMYVLSWVVENWKGWINLPKDVKFLLPMVASVLLSVGASQLLKYPEVVATIQPWFQILMTSVLAYLFSQKAYMTSKKAEYGKRFISRTTAVK